MLPPRQLWPELVYPQPGIAYPARINAASELLDATARRFGGDRPCLLTPTEQWSYAQAAARSAQVAGALAGLGVVPGNRVLLRGPNDPWLAIGWLAVLKAGGVAVTTMPMLRAGELALIGERSAPTVALCDERFVDDLVDAAIPGLRIVTYGTPSSELAQLAGRQPATFADVPTAADDVAMIAFTSGTTGGPKATLHFHRDLLATADTFSAQVLRPVPDDVFVGSPPLAFTYGLGGLLLFPLRAGAATLLLERPTPEALLQSAAELGATVLVTAPTAYRAMLAGPSVSSAARLRRCVSAGETLPASTWETFRGATGQRIIDGIGSTEMLHIFISSAADNIRPGSTGREVPGYRATVLDPEGRPVPDGESGRLAVKGPTGCRYLGGDRQTSYVQDGWNITGDTFVRDSDGYFWYQARSDDMIVSAGYNISGPEVEDALLGHPAVAECGVVGVPDPERTSLVTAYVVLSHSADPASHDLLARELQEHVKSAIAPYKYPRVIHFVDHLPRTATGKLQRYRLREQATEGSPEGGGHGP